jgi:hypothetical protein
VTRVTAGLDRIVEPVAETVEAEGVVTGTDGLR